MIDPGVKTAEEGIKALSALKDLPLWLLAACATTAIAFFLVFGPELEKGWRLFVVFGVILFSIFAVFRAIDLVIQWWKQRQATNDLKRTFHLTPITQSGHWSTSRQSDDTYVTQIGIDFDVKNRTQAPLGLARARLIKPSLEGEVLTDMIFVKAVRGNLYGTASVSGHTIPPGTSLPARVTIMIRGRPKNPPSEDMIATLAVSDDEGNEQRVRVRLRGFAPPPVQNLVHSREPAFAIGDPLDRQLVPVLQSELNRYDKCGRRVGGLGSVHLIYNGHPMTGVGGDSWTPDVPKVQSIVDDTGAAVLNSDNLAAVLALNAQLQSTQDKERLAALVLDKIDAKKGYLSISYFLVCVLWQLGHLPEALERAKSNLPQGDIKEFGLSNVLMLLNGLLRYRHTDFSPQMLDEIERFIHGLNEHTFLIAEKIADIRTRRLQQSYAALSTTTRTDGERSDPDQPVRTA